MKIAIIGAGGVGGYFGARLHEAGEDVVFVARGEHLAAIQNSGLKVHSSLGDMHLTDVKCTNSVGDIGTVDLVVIAVKLWATDSAVNDCRPLLHDYTGIVSFQNGIMAEQRIEATYTKKHSLGGVANIAALIEEPGVIRHNGSMASLYFGELDNSHSERTQIFLEACTRANIAANIPEDINATIWEKYIRLMTMSSMTSLCRMPIGPIRENPKTRKLLKRIIEEVIAVAKEHKIVFPENVLEEQLKIIDSYPATMVASMCGDLRRGNRLELPWLAGMVSALGKKLGIATPATDFVDAALTLFELGRPDDAQI